MHKYYIRPMEPAEYGDFYKRIEADFSPGEYAPYEVLYWQLQNGVQEGMVFCDGDRNLAYSICAAGHPNGYVLISLLAVFPECRGQGIGTAFMKALCNKYSQKQAVLVEVERPELSETQDEQSLRNRRIAFYEKEGFYLIPGTDYWIWDVPMHLMARPLKAPREFIDKNINRMMYEIYYQLMGEKFIHKMEFREAQKMK